MAWPSWLESWRAYAALYQLLHPDAQAMTPFADVARWYAEHFGLQTEPLEAMVFGISQEALEALPTACELGASGQE